MKKRILALLLVCTMLMSVFPVLALEGEEPADGNGIIIEDNTAGSGDDNDDNSSGGTNDDNGTNGADDDNGTNGAGEDNGSGDDNGTNGAGEDNGTNGAGEDNGSGDDNGTNGSGDDNGTNGSGEDNGTNGSGEDNGTNGAGEDNGTNGADGEEAELDLYTQLMAAETVEDAQALTAGMGEEDILAFLDLLTSEQHDALMARLAAWDGQEAPEAGDPAVDFTQAGPFLPPVKGISKSRRLMTAGARTTGVGDALMTAGARTTEGDDALVTSKTLSGPVDDVYTLTLETYATGQVTVTPTERNIPADIVLVLDQSGSMADFGLSVPVSQSDTSRAENYKYGGKEVRYQGGKWEYDNGYQVLFWWIEDWKDVPSGSSFQIQKLAALQDAVEAFVADVREKSKGDDGIADTADDIAHRVAIVGFASERNNGNNTEILTVLGNNSGTVGVNYDSVNDTNAAAALVSCGNSIVDDAINALAAAGTTRTDLGIKLAQRILARNPLAPNEERSRVVIMFTDGKPTSNTAFDATVANSAISYSKQLKDEGTAVYTIGVFDGADPSSLTSNENKFMNYTSSNYPNASSMTLPGTGGTTGGGYYLSAGSANALDDIFQSIADQIEDGSTTVTLGANAIVRDVITPYFQLAGTEAASITAYDVAYLGNGTWSTTHGTSYTPSYNTGTQTIDVSGFDFKNNYKWDNSALVPSYGGKKLVIEVKIKAKDAFWGGNNVPTNGAGSGVYEDASHTNSVEAFPLPQANVPLKTPTVTGINYNIYAGNPAPTHEALINVTDIPTGWETAYVTVVRSPNPISNLESDTHTVTVTVTPQDPAATSVGAPAVTWSESADATVTVFKPVVTFRDSAVNQGEAVAGYDYNTHNLGTVTWMNGTTPAPASMGPAPTLTYTYTPNTTAENFQTDTNVCVTSVKNGDVEINSVTSFYWQAGGSTECPTGETDPNPTNQFRVHVIRPEFNLTITKTVTSGTPTQSFIFDIKRVNDSDVYMSVVLSPDKFANGNSASVTIYGLPSGSYTVTERGNWSWQYVLDATEQTQPVNDHNKTVTFANKRNDVNWLGDAAICSNIFGVRKGQGGGTA